MAVLTAAQIIDMQGDLAIGDDESVFTDDELQRFYVRAGEDYNTAVYYGWLQILSGSAKWVDYQVAQTKVSRSQAFANIKAMLAVWKALATTGANQVLIAGMNPVPPRHKPVPADEYPHPRTWPYPWRRWR